MGIKFNQNTEMKVIRIVAEEKMPDGVTRRVVRSSIEDKPIDLGSFNKPKNQDIIRIEWENKNKRKNQGLGFPFGNLFG